MRTSEKGYTLIDMLVALSIMTIISTSALLVTYQVMHGIGRNNDRMDSVRQLDNAAHWISRDTKMAKNVSTDNLTFPDFLAMNWVEWDIDGEPIYHSTTYFFEDMTNNIGALKRNSWSSIGGSQQTLIAQHIYFNSDNETDTSRVSYASPILSMKLTSSYDDLLESREYEIVQRLNY